MRKLLFCLVSLCALTVSAQVTTSPNPIPVGYTDSVTITFDPTRGNGGMEGATDCYLYSCVEVDNSGKWEYQLAAWPSKSAKTKMTQSGSKWTITIPNLYTFYGIPAGKAITRMLVLFTDGVNGGQTGRGVGDQDIVIVIGEETIDIDIWDGVEGLMPTVRQRPAGVSNGIYYDSNDPTKVTLCTYAASKTQAAKRVFLLGDMTNWKLDAKHQLYKDGNYFWITLDSLTPGQEYRFQYAVERADGVKKQICDLYSEKVLHPDDKWEPKSVDPTLIDYPTKGADGGYVTVIQTNKPQFQWSQATLNFQRPKKENLIIYELWVFDYATNRTFQGVIDRLDYLENLGVNAIELMPVSEFGGNQSWGYNPVLYFAVDKTYGKAEDLKRLVDECHKRGIAVIVDMVFNHTNGLNPMAKLYPWTSSTKSESELNINPWFNLYPPEGNNGYGDEEWNHDFAPAHEMFSRVFKYWLTEYKVDGFRLDLSHGLCGTTNDAVSNLIDYYQNAVKATSRDAYMILEHWGDGKDQLISYGMKCWTGNVLCEAYYYTTEGRLINSPNGFDDANRDGYVSYCESHDEERMQYLATKDGLGSIKTDKNVRLGRVAEQIAFNVLLNGPHMLWQYQEIGYDISIDYNGRTGTKPNPASKGYFNDAARIEAFTKCAQMITLRTRLMPQVFEGNPTAVNIGSGYVTRTVQWGSDVFVMANFSASENQSLDLPSGIWYDYFNNASLAASSYSLAPGEVMVFTGTPVQAPTFADIEHRDHQGVENIPSGDTQGTKILHDGQILILRGDKIYDVMGRRIR